MFLISNLRRIRSPQIAVGADLVADPLEARGQLRLSRGEALGGPASPVSIVVPEGSTKRSERRVE